LRRLALFDLDGTLTRGDTFRGFVLKLLLARPARWPRAPLLALPIAGFILKLIDRGRLKGSFIHLLFAGMSRAEIDAFARSYATSVLANDMFPEALAALRGHLAAGDHVVLLSASPDLYVHEIGKLLGVHQSTCTEVRWEGDRLEGHLAGPNRRDKEKARVLALLRAANPGMPVIAYGNSSPDLDHMRLCEEGVYVNADRKLAARLAAELPAIRCVQWG
jgi:HAD superfamily hydrolase (TIGR01490 family)